MPLVGLACSSPTRGLFAVNPTFCRILQYTQEELLSMDWADISHPDELQNDLEHYQKVLAGDLNSYSLEKRYIRKDGLETWVEIDVQCVRTADGSIDYFIAFVSDINKRKAAEINQLQEFNQSKVLAENLKKQVEQLNEFTRIIAHNLRSPVANLNFLIEFYRREEDPREREGFFEQFVEVAKNLMGTIDDLSEALKVQNLKDIPRTKENLEAALGRARVALGFDLEKSRALIESNFTAAPEVVMPRSYLDSIFLNMISNSIRYTNPGEPPVIHIQSTRFPGYTELTFKDQGMGLDLERHGHRLFGLHQVFHRHPDSRGVGLFITHMQVTALGGKIVVESEPGKGISFAFQIPDL